MRVEAFMKRQKVVIKYSCLKIEPVIILPENEAKRVAEWLQAIFDSVYGVNHAQVLTVE